MTDRLQEIRETLQKATPETWSLLISPEDLIWCVEEIERLRGQDAEYYRVQGTTELKRGLALEAQVAEKWREEIKRLQAALNAIANGNILHEEDQARNHELPPTYELAMGYVEAIFQFAHQALQPSCDGSCLETTAPCSLHRPKRQVTIT